MACGLSIGLAMVCAGQAYTPPPPPLTTLPPCPVDKDAKKRAKRKDCDPTVYPPETVKPKKGEASAAPAGPAAAQQFPFPGEQKSKQPAVSTPAANAYPYPGEGPGSGVGQSPDKANPDGSQARPASPAGDAGTTYPYPGEEKRDVPHDPAAEKKATDTPAGKAFPFPGGTSADMPREDGETAPAKGDSPDQRIPDGSSSSSSASSASSSSSDAGDAAQSSSSRDSGYTNSDDEDPNAPPKLKDEGSSGKRGKNVIKAQTDTERVDEDLTVAKFYSQSGNAMGAYLRAKDAVKTQPDFPEAHFVLGEAAKRLNKKDEAAAEFTAYLKLAPDGERAKAAEKALEEVR